VDMPRGWQRNAAKARGRDGVRFKASGFRQQASDELWPATIR
jgi:hypothetical protein